MGDALGDQAQELRAVAVADRAHLGVGAEAGEVERAEAVGRLVDEREVGVERAAQALGRRQRGVGLGEREQLVGLGADRREVEAALASEVVVEQPLRDAGGGRDVVDRQLVVGVLGEQLAADREQLARGRSAAGAASCVLTSVQGAVYRTRHELERCSNRRATPRDGAADLISYEDLYARWEQGNWSATELDFTEDARQWREELHRVRAQGGAVELRAVLLGRGRRRRQPLALHRRGAAGGAEVLPHHAAGRRGAPRGLLQALHARGLRHRRRHDGERAAGDQAAAHVGLPQDLRPPRHDGRRAAQGPLAGEAGGGRDALPHRDRGDARAARPALHHRLPGGARPAARRSARGWRTSRATSSATSASA